MSQSGILLTAANRKWLLSPEQPTVRYRTLTELLGRAESDQEVQEAKAAIMTTGPVVKILSKMSPGGYWGDPVRFYGNKYRGTVWSLIMLAELRADGSHERVRQACEYILQSSQNRESGGFSYSGNLTSGGTKEGIISCLTGNLIYTLNRLDYSRDERVARAVSWLCRYQRFSDGEPPEKVWPYLQKRCWEPRECRSAAVKVMKALHSVPLAQRTDEVRKAIQRGAEFLLEQCIYGGGTGLKGTARKEWFRLGYPHMWDTDLLEILSNIVNAGIRNERLDTAVEFVLSRRNERGRWTQEGRDTERFLTRLEKKGQESRFVTLEVLLLMKKLNVSEH